MNNGPTSLGPRNPWIVFLAENVANLEALPGADFDGDGLADRWELANQLDPFDPTDAEIDPDKDGLTNFEEACHGTNPRNADTDGDAASDFIETAQGSNPKDAADAGQRPNDGDAIAIRLRVGDPSGSRSERYRLDVGPIPRCQHQSTTRCGLQPRWLVRSMGSR